jgi:hypothetical protein
MITANGPEQDFGNNARVQDTDLITKRGEIRSW